MIESVTRIAAVANLRPKLIISPRLSISWFDQLGALFAVRNFPASAPLLQLASIFRRVIFRSHLWWIRKRDVGGNGSRA